MLWPRKLTRVSAGCEISEVCDCYTQLRVPFNFFLKFRVFRLVFRDGVWTVDFSWKRSQLRMDRQFC